MKKSRKFIIGATAVAALVVGGVTTFLATAWGDSGGGRPSYTIDQINQGVLGDKIIFNTISNSVIGNEKNFVGARVDDGDHGTDNKWSADEIAAEDGKTYIVRLYVHNNNPKGEQAVAENVRTAFSIPSASGKSVDVNGLITSSNADPDAYWDNVRFTSNSNFHLEYISGSALLENNGIGKGGGIKLSDNVTTQNGTLIGYNALDGRIPGCYQYASYVTIKVKVKYDDQPFLVEKQVRKAGQTTDWRANWTESINANIGDEVEYRIHYKNTTSERAADVMVKDVLPNNESYVEGSTYLYSSTHQQGFQLYDDITTKGVNIGDYSVKGDGYVIFKAKVNDDSLNCGSNTLVNWGQVTANGKAYQDSADVTVTKPCEVNFTTEKTVRIGGTGDWEKSVDANVGDEVEYRIAYKNTGDTKAVNVNMRDTLPSNVQFVSGSAKLYNATESGKSISDDIVKNGVNIGDYEAGQTAYVTFKVKVVDESLVCGNNKLTNSEKTAVNDLAKQDTADVTVNKRCETKFTTKKQVRISGTQDWYKSISANIGDEVEYRIDYKNTGDTDMKDVTVKDVLPGNVSFVSGSAKLHKDSEETAVDDTLVTTGVNIGDYKAGDSAYITFKAKVTDQNLVCGNNTLTNTENTTVDKTSLQDVADVRVKKDCYEPYNPTVTPSEMPTTGPSDVISGVIGIGAVTTAAGYYVASRKQLKH